MDVIFNCSNCSQKLAVDEAAVGQEIACTTCGTRLTVPPPALNRTPPPLPQSPLAEPAPTAGAKAAGPPSEAVTETAKPTAPMDLRGSLGQSLRFYASNANQVWFFTMRSGFRALGALFEGRLFQLGLAVTDYFLKLKSRQPSPDANFARIMELTSSQLGGATGGVFRGMGAAIFAVLLGVIGTPLCFVVGLAVGTVSGAGGLIGVLAALGVLSVAAFMYFRALATMVLGLGVAVKLGPGEFERRKEEAASLLKGKEIPFALYLSKAFFISLSGIVLCFMGIFLTIPCFPAAMYIGMINALGITEQDVDRFLER